MTADADRRREQLERWEHWLRLRHEEPLYPAQSIVDPHHHLWDRGGHTYLSEQFRSDIGINRVVASVYVECMSSYRHGGPADLRPVGETEAVIRLASGSKDLCEVARGIVGFADLSRGARAAEVLNAHQDIAGLRFKGVRYVTAWDPDPAIHGAYATHSGMLLEPALRNAAAVLEERGLSLDLWLYFHQLSEAASLARACPGLSIILNHCGGPIGIGLYAPQRQRVFEEWREKLEPFRSLAHVTIKFGGLAMPMAGFAWKSRRIPPNSDELAEAWRSYFDVCLDIFGPHRCMFESNFPVDRSGCSYTALWNAFKRLSDTLSPSERDALFEHTARRVYRL